MYFIDDFKKINKEMYKRDVKRNEGSHNFGTTAKDAVTYDKLISLLEDIETQCEIVLSLIDIPHDQGNPVSYNKETSQRLFSQVKKASSMLSSLRFKGLPQTDINNLNKYAESIGAYYDRFLPEYTEVKRLADVGKQNRQRDPGDEGPQPAITGQEIRVESTFRSYLFMPELETLFKRLTDSIMIYNSGATPVGNQQADPKTFVGGSLKGHPMYQNQEYI